MENQTAFDLNEQLKAWREHLAHSLALGGKSLDELEIHLRDSIGRLQATGLSEEEAFGVAVGRIPYPGQTNPFYSVIYPVGKALALLLVSVVLARKRVSLRKAG